jgi:hypothetical protein
MERIESLVQRRDHVNLKALQPQLEEAIRGKARPLLSSETAAQLQIKGISLFNSNRRVEDEAGPRIMYIACTLMNCKSQFNSCDAVALMRSYKKAAEALSNIADTDTESTVACYDAAIEMFRKLGTRSFVNDTSHDEANGRIDLAFRLMMGRAGTGTHYTQPALVLDLVNQMKSLLPYCPENRGELAEFAAKCGNDLNEVQQPVHAARFFNEALAIVEDDMQKTATKPIEWLLGLAVAYIEDGDTEKASAALAIVSEDDCRSLLLFVKLHLKARSVDQAMGAYTQLLQRPDCDFKNARTAALVLSENLDESDVPLPPHEGCESIIGVFGSLASAFPEKAAEINLEALDQCLRQCPDDSSGLDEILHSGQPLHSLAIGMVAGLQPLPAPMSSVLSSPTATSVELAGRPPRGHGQLKPAQQKRVVEVLEGLACVASNTNDGENNSHIAWLQLARDAIVLPTHEEASNNGELEMMRVHKARLELRISYAQIESGRPLEALEGLQNMPENVSITQLFLKVKALLCSTAPRAHISEAFVAFAQHSGCTEDYITAIAEEGYNKLIGRADDGSGSESSSDATDTQRFVVISSLLELADRKSSKTGRLMPLRQARQLVATPEIGSTMSSSTHHFLKNVPFSEDEASQLVAVYNKARECCQDMLFDSLAAAAIKSEILVKLDTDGDGLSVCGTPAEPNASPNRELPQLVWLADNAFNDAIGCAEYAGKMSGDVMAKDNDTPCAGKHSCGVEEIQVGMPATKLLALRAELCQLSADLREKIPKSEQSKEGTQRSLHCLLTVCDHRVRALGDDGGGGGGVQEIAAAFKAIRVCREFIADNKDVFELDDANTKAFSILALLDFQANLYSVGVSAPDATDGTASSEGTLMGSLHRLNNNTADSSIYEQLGHNVEQQIFQICSASADAGGGNGEGSKKQLLRRVAEKAYGLALQHLMRESSDNFGKLALLWRKIFDLTDSPQERLKLLDQVKQFADKNQGKYPPNELLWFANKAWSFARRLAGGSLYEKAKPHCEIAISFLTSIESALAGTSPANLTSSPSPLSLELSPSLGGYDIDPRAIASYLSNCTEDYEKLLSAITAR